VATQPANLLKNSAMSKFLKKAGRFLIEALKLIFEVILSSGTIWP
jgi:hypothetical protein